MKFLKGIMKHILVKLVCCFSVLFYVLSVAYGQNCSVLSSVSAGHRFALGYDGPVTYSADFCKQPFSSFSWHLANYSTTSLELVNYEHQTDTANCIRTQGPLPLYDSTCSQINETCYSTNITYSGNMTLEMDETWFALRFDGFNETCFETPYPHINIHECRSTYPNINVSIETTESCGFGCDAYLFCKSGCTGNATNATCTFNATWSDLPVCSCPGPSTDGLSPGAIAGIVFACVVGALLIGASIFYLYQNDFNFGIKHRRLEYGVET